MTPLHVEPVWTTPYEETVDADAVAAYARATNDPNPRYEDGSAVPPLFTVTMVLPAHTELHRTGAGRLRIRGATGAVHGQHDVVLHAPVRPGTVLRCSGTTRSVRRVGRGVLLTQRLVLTDTSDELVVEHLWSTLHIDATTDVELGTPVPDHSFPEAARARPLASCVVPVDRDQTYRYAGVSGDRIGHSMSDAVARAEGHPGKILQGMCTFGLAAGALVDAVAGGDPDRVRRLAVRFSRPAFPGRELEVLAYDAGRTPDGAQAVAFEALQGDVVVLRHGRIELAA